MYEQRTFPETHLLGIRRPRKDEDTEADLIFIREDDNGNIYEIYVSLSSGFNSWMQWGQPKEILGDNVEDLEMYIEDMKMFDL